MPTEQISNLSHPHIYPEGRDFSTCSNSIQDDSSGAMKKDAPKGHSQDTYVDSYTVSF